MSLHGKSTGGLRARWRPGIASSALLVALAAAPAGALKGLDVGRPLPAFSLPDLSGTVHAAAELSGGPAVILFWSTWSPRSAEVLSDFTAYQAELADKGLRVVAVNVDGENLSAARRREVREYAERMALPFPVLLDERLEAFVAYGVMAHPSVVVAGGDGRISYLLGGYPLSLREELKNAVLASLGLPVERAAPVPSTTYLEQGASRHHYSLGLALLEKGQEDRALDAFGRAMSAAPSFVEPVIMSARVRLSLGETEEAGRLVEGMNADAADRGDLRFLLASLALARGDAEGAERAFREEAQRSPSEGWGRWGLGAVALSRGDAAAALEMMEGAGGPPPPEVEAVAREFLRSAWIKGGEAPEEVRLVAIFPRLTSVRDRYRSLFRMMKEGG